jgi:hypothetical protein
LETTLQLDKERRGGNDRRIASIVEMHSMPHVHCSNGQTAGVRRRRNTSSLAASLLTGNRQGPYGRADSSRPSSLTWATFRGSETTQTTRYVFFHANRSWLEQRAKSESRDLCDMTLCKGRLLALEEGATLFVFVVIAMGDTHVTWITVSVIRRYVCHAQERRPG